jgi:hypothetical protein
MSRKYLFPILQNQLPRIVWTCRRKFDSADLFGIDWTANAYLIALFAIDQNDLIFHLESVVDMSTNALFAFKN